MNCLFHPWKLLWNTLRMAVSVMQEAIIGAFTVYFICEIWPHGGTDALFHW